MKLLELFVEVMTLVGNQCALGVEKSFNTCCKYWAVFCRIQSQSDGSRIYATGYRLSASTLTFDFLCHVAPKARLQG